MLSNLEPAGDSGTPRGLLRVAGRTIVEHQLAAVIAFGCEQVLCLGDGFPRELMAVQRLAESRGVRFAMVSDGHGLARSLAPQDDVLVISGGLLAPASEMIALLEEGNGIVVQPADLGVPAGFERLDLHDADAGVMRLPGGLACRLAQLPGDWNPFSSLLRIAAQSGIERRVLPDRLNRNGYWLLVRDEAEAQAIEPRWLRLHTSVTATRGPGAWLAAALVQRFGPALLHAGTPPRLVTAAALLLVAAGLALGWSGMIAPAFVCLGLAWIANTCGDLLARILRDSLPVIRRRWRLAPLFCWLLDAVLVTCCVWRLEQAEGQPLERLPAGFVALTVFGLLRLLPGLVAERRWGSWIEDRSVVAVLLALAAGTPVFAPALMAAALLMIGLAMAITRPRRDAQAPPKAAVSAPHAPADEASSGKRGLCPQALRYRARAE